MTAIAPATEKTATPPRDRLIRAVMPGPVLRDAGDGVPVLHGHFAVFNEWAEIDSIFEGHFLERIAPGAFAKTMTEKRDQIRVLFQHGRDGVVGDKPLGSIESLEEDDVGAAYAVRMLDTSYNADLLPGLRAGLYGASFRFRVVKEDFDAAPKKTSSNPAGIPERTIREAEVFEFGPVTFPAYAQATAGVRSLTDEFLFTALADDFGRDPQRLREVVSFIRHDAATAAAEPESDSTRPAEPEPRSTPSSDAAEPTAPTRAAEDTTEKETTMGSTIEELRSELKENQERQKSLAGEWTGQRFDDSAQAEWNQLGERHDEIVAILKEDDERRSRIETFAEQGAVERAVTAPRNGNGASGGSGSVRMNGGTGKARVPTDIWDMSAYRRENEFDSLNDAYVEGARRAIEIRAADIPGSPEDSQARIERLLAGDGNAVLARRILATGDPVYLRAFAKAIAERPLTTEEQNALARGADLERTLSEGTTTAGGFAVPFVLDPTIILANAGAVNPIRRIARNITITTNIWKGVSSAGVTASYDPELAEVSDDTPTLAQPTIQVEMARAFIPFSIEVGEDWPGMRDELARLFADAKNTLEADKFLNGAGHGSTEPQGLLTGATTTFNTSATGAFGVGDLYAIAGALPARYRANASWLANFAIFSLVRGFDTSGGAALWAQLGVDNPPLLLGKPAYEASYMGSTHAASDKIAVFGDFNYFAIVDRVGLNVELVPHLFGTNRRPIGARGLFAYWRNSSGVLVPDAFRVLVVHA